jgi:exodeoxyribonuclease VII small subunit
MTKTGKDTQETYGELRLRLDGIVAKLQDPDCDVDQAADLYKQAMQAIGRLETYLQQAENNVRKVQADLNADGLVD